MKECGKASSAQSTSSSWGSQQFSVWTALHHESFFCLVLAIPSIVDALLLAINTSGFITWAPITWLFTFLPESGWNKEQDQARPPDHQAAVWCVCASVIARAQSAAGWPAELRIAASWHAIIMANLLCSAMSELSSSSFELFSSTTYLTTTMQSSQRSFKTASATK